MEEIKSPNKTKIRVHVYGYIELEIEENKMVAEIKKQVLSMLSEHDLKFTIEIPPNNVN